MPTDESRALAANVAALANDQQVTLSELSRRTSGQISAERIRKCITGRDAFLLSEAKAIAEALGVDLSDLTSGAAA